MRRGVLRRALARVSPLRVLFEWVGDGWADEDGWKPTWKSEVADAILWKLRVGAAIFRCLFVRSECTDNTVGWPWALFYRMKAAICLFFGWHHPGESHLYRHMETHEVLTWHGRVVGYYEPEYEEDLIEVAAGWRNWYVELRHCHEDGCI